MTEKITTFTELITDEDGDYSRAQYMDLARKIIEEGRDPHRVFISMLRAALAASLEHSVKEHYDFVRAAHKHLSAYKPELEEQLDEMIAAEKAHPV